MAGCSQLCRLTGAGIPAAETVLSCRDWRTGCRGRHESYHLGPAAAVQVLAAPTFRQMPCRCCTGLCRSQISPLPCRRCTGLCSSPPPVPALQVLAHRVQGPASPFATYITHLPIGIQGLPIFFPREAVAALQYPPLTSQVQRRCRFLLQFTTQSLQPLAGTSDDPFEGQVDANALGELQQTPQK